MKIKVRVVTDVEFDFNHPVVDLDKARTMASALEAGWRFGVVKDMAMLKEVYRQQFGMLAGVTDPVLFFDFTYFPSAPESPIGHGKSGVTS